MTQDERIELLTQVASGIAKLMGDETEVVLHDLITRRVVFLKNGHITGRTQAYRINPSVGGVISSLADGEGHMIGYGSKSVNGKKMRSSHFIFTNEEDTPCAMICINQDTSRMESLIGYLENMIHLQPMVQHNILDPDDHGPIEITESYIQSVTKNVINDTYNAMKSQGLDTRERKIEFIRCLREKGVFDVKDSFANVCEVLDISQATLYNYIREIKTEEMENPIYKYNLQLR